MFLDYETQLDIPVGERQRLRCAMQDFGGTLGVFLHGFRSSLHGTKSGWLAEHAAARKYSWTRFDFRGHGESSGDLASFSISSAVEDICSVLDTMADRPLLLVGSSMGGWIAVLAARKRPGLIKGMLLIAPAFNFIRDHFSSLSPVEMEAWRNSRRKQFVDEEDGQSFELDYSIVEDSRQYDIFHLPHRLDCPVRIIHGENDPVVPLTNSQRFMDLYQIPQANLRVIADGGHSLNNAADDIIELLDSLWQEVT